LFGLNLTAGVPCICITREAGTVKTRKERIMPLHPHLLDQDFREFASKKRGAAPLFYSLARQRNPNRKNPTCTSVGNKLAHWVRNGLKIEDQSVAPNHGWRHRFKTIARRVRMAPASSSTSIAHPRIVRVAGLRSRVISMKRLLILPTARHYGRLKWHAKHLRGASRTRSKFFVPWLLFCYPGGGLARYFLKLQQPSTEGLNVNCGVWCAHLMLRPPQQRYRAALFLSSRFGRLSTAGSDQRCGDVQQCDIAKKSDVPR
jgi:hypothetical protein